MIIISKLGSAFRSMEKVWNGGGMSLCTKLKLLNTIVISVLLYGSDSWKGVERERRKITKI